MGNIGPTEDAAMRGFPTAANQPPAQPEQPDVQARGDVEPTICYSGTSWSTISST